MSNIENFVPRLNDMFKALANPHRLHLFEQLRQHDKLPKLCHSGEAQCFCVCELGENLDIAPSTLSHHLKELHRAGLINMQRCGKNVECSINSEALAQLKNYFAGTPL